MKQLKKHAIGYNTVSSKNGVINGRGVKSKPNNLEIFGYTREIGEGEKSPDNPYILQSLDSGAMSADGVEYEHSIKLNNSSETIKVPVPVALNCVQNISDYIYKDSGGVWKLVQNCQKYTFTGDETIIGSGVIDGKRIFGIYVTDIVNNYKNTQNAVTLICTHYTSFENFDINYFRANAPENSACFNQLASQQYPFMFKPIQSKQLMSVDTCAKIIKGFYENGTPLAIIYQLETPIEHVLSDYAQNFLNSFELQNDNEIFVEGYPDLKVSGYIQK